MHVIHRDLKPDNILLDAPRHTLKIADFGMARTFTRGNAYTDHCVTSWYRPPEIILGDRCYGPPVDLWSMGCVLAEMLALAAPFCCSTEVECLLQIFRLRGTPDEDTWPGVSTLPHYNASFPRWRPQPAAARPRNRALGEPEIGLWDDTLSDGAVPEARVAVLSLLSPEPTTVDDLVRRCHLSPSVTVAVLLELELTGRIETRPGGYIVLLPDAFG